MALFGGPLGHDLRPAGAAVPHDDHGPAARRPVGRAGAVDGDLSVRAGNAARTGAARWSSRCIGSSGTTSASRSTVPARPRVRAGDAGLPGQRADPGLVPGDAGAEPLSAAVLVPVPVSAGGPAGLVPWRPAAARAPCRRRTATSATCAAWPATGRRPGRRATSGRRPSAWAA